MFSFGSAGSLLTKRPAFCKLNVSAASTLTQSPSSVPSIGETAAPSTSKPTLTLPIEAGAYTLTILNSQLP